MHSLRHAAGLAVRLPGADRRQWVLSQRRSRSPWHPARSRARCDVLVARSSLSLMPLVVDQAQIMGSAPVGNGKDLLLAPVIMSGKAMNGREEARLSVP